MINLENLSFEFTSKEYRSNIECIITVKDTENDEYVFSGQFYANLDWLDEEECEVVRDDLRELEKYCFVNNFQKVQKMMKEVFSWNYVAYDDIDFI